MKKNKHSLKMIIIGDSGVGKTSLVHKFCKNQFKIDYSTTIGIEFESKDIKVNQKDVQLQIWDTAGQERFKSLIKSFYFNSICVFLVYSIDW